MSETERRDSRRRFLKYGAAGVAAVAVAGVAGYTMLQPSGPQGTTETMIPTTTAATQTQVPTTGAAPVIKIGAAFAATGPKAYGGSTEGNSVQLALKHANDEGGIGGKKVDYAWEDGMCSPVEGVSAFYKLLYDHQVVASYDGGCSGVMLAISPIAKEKQVPILGTVESNPKIRRASGVGGNEWIFPVQIPDDLVVVVTMEAIAPKYDWKKVAHIAVDNDYGRGVGEAIDKLAPQYGIEVVSNDYYRMGENDYTPFLNRIKRSTPDVFFMTCQDIVDAAKIIQQSHELGLESQLFVFGNQLSDYLTELVTPALAEGLLGHVTATYDEPETASFYKEFMDTYNYAPHSDAYICYTSGRIMVEALKIAEKFDGPSIRDALKKVDFESPLGRVYFDDHNAAWMPFIVAGVKDGKVYTDYKCFAEKCYSITDYYKT